MSIDENHWVHTARGAAPQWIRDHANYQGDDCIGWPFMRDPGVGRGRIGQHTKGTAHHTKLHWAHRVMCEYVKGPAPPDKPQAAHSCGNGHKACMNQNHLDWASQSENHLDRRRHGTANTNPHGGVSKLPPETIAEIRSLKGKEPQMTTAARFGISHANVRYWQKSTHEPRKYGTSSAALRRAKLRGRR